jgi:uncharacterized protein (DUF1684 family)
MRFPLLLSLLVAASPPVEDAAYRATIEKWRAEREARLKTDSGWLTVVGLGWLKEGANTFGSATSNDIVLPAGSAAPRAGVFELRQGKVSVRVEPGVTLTTAGNAVRAMEVRSDTSGTPDVLSLGRLTLHLIDRQGRLGIRIKDTEAEARRNFAGLRWFPIKESYRLTARFERYDPPRTVDVPNILGQVERLTSPGALVFSLGGQEQRIDPVFEESGATELFVIFRDQTSGSETYGAGRFLYTEIPKGDTVILDFNKAYTPPCAFTAFATCPLPPKQNRLGVRVEAGEKTPPGHVKHAGS